MSRLFAYCRVSTADQTTDNQVKEIEAAGFAVVRRDQGRYPASGETSRRSLASCD